ncbi:bifunctional ADP-dependent NAD(P)H-hydrate dehydratase/NAD(P)H-hydrate epimerase [Marivita hallyeonensis]|uniref:Bifunctional NAD(P)H-hydrate repair enzyme n=1 Tax=Marivita hallyeonensis TaxID=996342 RepID=A0A1M5VS28_9RHOB|nr:bifunctional ADP-dependent NAD(P)H-hydrate dehydratase/NAD(P)H-hydrate epimerase [Marivita hallyeonensis]SHH78066.1 yjeF C-terminal region, hydroxyethylthiazole kinase-related/yjeF N-terminal region [Marivita hallyeonensis]
MTELLTSAQMRAIELAEIDSGVVTGLQLMERAGRGAVAAALARWPELATGAHRAMILCGPGNNGGDGFVIARRLKDRGWDIDVFLFGDAEKLPPDAKINHDLWTEQGTVTPLDHDAMRACGKPDLFVDAVFGTGLTRPLPDALADALDAEVMRKWRGSHKIRRLAIDCPSGLNLDTGMLPQPDKDEDEDALFVPKMNCADLTVAFHSLKLGHKIGMGPAVCGTVEVVDIGLTGEDATERSMIGLPPDRERVRLIDPIFVQKPLPTRFWPGSCVAKEVGGHKYDFGHVMVLSGGPGRGGAGRMAARTALRAGAGLVTLLCPPDALQENACHLNAVMLRPCADADAFRQIADDRVTALCLGPGMGVGPGTRAFVRAALAHSGGDRAWRETAIVLDADALISFEENPATLFADTHARTVLTPHEGEFARLFPDLSQAERGDLSKVDAVRIAADRAGCIVLLKGVDTVIAQPGGGASVHSATGPRSVPWLATAGAGDVLAGLIAGLAAMPTSPDLFCVVEAAVWLHCEAALQFGPGLIAEDLPDMLPKVFSTLAT